MEYAIVDIETTGNHRGDDCITEVAIIITDGKKELNRYETLINPQSKIPKFISYLTGITEEMVETAPLFSDVAEEIMSYLEGRIFVAHNVNFDYKILKMQFEKVGIKLPGKRLCTVKLARQIIPGLPSYSLGKLSASLGIKLEQAHRAMPDTQATTELFHLLFQKDNGQMEKMMHARAKVITAPLNVSKEVFNGLPTYSGVYYFHDAKGKVIYIGKAKNIKTRVNSHFTGKNQLNKKGLAEDVFDISCEPTGNEVVASLLEEAEIKHYWPKYNRSQKGQVMKFAVYAYKDRNGLTRLGINKKNPTYNGIMQFPSLNKARTWLLKQIELYNLNATYCGMSHFALDEVEDDIHEQKTRQFLNEYLANENTVVWKGRGRCNGEVSFVLLENGVYKGFGFLDADEAVMNVEQLYTYLQPQHDTNFVRRILRSKMMAQQMKKVNYTEVNY